MNITRCIFSILSCAYYMAITIINEWVGVGVGVGVGVNVMVMVHASACGGV